MSSDKNKQDDVTVQVATPRGVFEGTFPKTTKVMEVIAAIISQLNLDGGDAFELVYNGTVLTPVERPLVSFGLSGTVQLELVATGSGV
jgi:hypothetical protein